MKNIPNSQWWDSFFQQTIGNYDIINCDTLYVNHIRLLTASNTFISVEGQVVIANQVDDLVNLSVLNDIILTGSTNAISVGKANEDSNSAQIQFLYAGNHSTSNQVLLGFYSGGNKLTLPYGGIPYFNNSIKATVRAAQWYLYSTVNITTGSYSDIGYAPTWSCQHSSGTDLLTFGSGGWTNTTSETVWVTVTAMAEFSGSTGLTQLIIQKNFSGSDKVSTQQVTGADRCSTSCTLHLLPTEAFMLVGLCLAGSSITVFGSSVPENSSAKLQYVIHN